MCFCCCWCHHLTSTELTVWRHDTLVFASLISEAVQKRNQVRSNVSARIVQRDAPQPVLLLCSRPCLIHVIRKSWMHRVQKPLVSSSFLSTASSLHFLFLRPPSITLCPPFQTSVVLSGLFFFYSIFPICSFYSSLYTLSVTLLLHHTYHEHAFPHGTCSHSYNVHWCHLSASNETQLIKISISLARTFRPS